MVVYRSYIDTSIASLRAFPRKVSNQRGNISNPRGLVRLDLRNDGYWYNGNLVRSQTVGVRGEYLVTERNGWPPEMPLLTVPLS